MGTAANSVFTRVLAGLRDARAWQEEFYRNLHQHPELSHQERETAAAVARRLGGFGYDVHDGIGGTGVVGILRNGDGPAVLLRADMDALPVKEDTGLPYASTATATDADGNRVSVMHACGHDVHVTCLLGAAALLAGARGEWKGTVIALFPPRRSVTAPAPCSTTISQRWSAVSTSPSPSTSCLFRPVGWAHDPGPSSPPRTACGSPCMAAAATARCPRPPSIRWCSPP